MFSDFNWLDAVSSSPILLILITCSVVALGVVLERVYYFWRRRGTPRETLEKILSQVRNGQIKEATWTANATTHPLGSAAVVMLAKQDAADSELDERLHIALSEDKLLLEKNLGIIGTLAGVAPLVGLLGTVYGIMLAFHDMGATGSSAPSVVAAGVAEALLTTGAGLVIAVPCLVLYNQFVRRMNVMLTLAENGARMIRAAVHESQSPHDGEPHARPSESQLVETANERGELPVGSEL